MITPIDPGMLLEDESPESDADRTGGAFVVEHPEARTLVLFDDLYAGPRWRYGLPTRHAVHLLHSPAGAWILYSERPSDDPRFPFGTLDFPRELPQDVARQLDLVLIAASESTVLQ